jgi:hypothetical protein
VTSHLHNTLVLRIQDALAEIAVHDHANAPLSDIHCLNIKAWLGDQMPAVLRILAETQGDIDTLRAREMALADHATELLLAQHDQKES